MTYKIIEFDELSNLELYDILKLRTNVFVVEQNCPYPELDDKDQAAFHYLGSVNEEIIATSRILRKGISYKELSIGRVVVDERFRSDKIGYKMMKEILDFMNSKWPGESIRISAQSHLEKFYLQFGFVGTGKRYLEDGIPHIEMLKK